MNKILKKTLQILLSFALGGGILYWMYRNFDFAKMEDVMLHHMRWEWMLLSFIPGILAQVFRALRWQLALKPIGERCRTHVAVCAIYLSYAASLVIPRVGEFLRCGVLKNKDDVSFAKSLGAVLTERAVDMIVMLLLCCGVFLFQWQAFCDFFAKSGVSLSNLTSRFSSTGIMVTAICAVCIVILGLIVMKKMQLLTRVKATLQGLIEGVMSLKHVSNIPLYLIYSVGIWVAYFFHYYLTFFCFGFSENLGLDAALVSFCVGTVAVIVPTPNGAGSWHFAVKSVLLPYMLMLPGVVQQTAAENAEQFVLIVHTVQTLLLVALGIYAIVALQFTPKRSLREA